MTAHDPRVTLTEDERRDIGERVCWECAPRDIWGEVERIIAARLAPIRAVAEQWDTGCAREVLAALDATGADLRASQDHDGTHGPPETNRPSDHQQRLRATFLAAALEDQ